MPKVLVVDIGGNNIKVNTSGRRDPIKIPSGRKLTPARMAAEVRKAVDGWQYDVVSIGFPGAVRHGKALHEPHNLGRGWMRFDYQKAFRKPVKLVNDAAMQALGAYRGGRMLFLGLGTGLGSALVADGVLMPLELAHLPYRRGLTYEDYVGQRGLERLGRRKWTRHVRTVIDLLKAALQADYVVLGGGQAKKLTKLPPGVLLGGNRDAIAGGMRLWREPARESRPPTSISRSLRPTARARRLPRRRAAA
jgi:polyphosphate glucokinase